MAVESAGPYASLHLLQTDNHTSTPPLCFYRQDALPAAKPTASKHWRQSHQRHITSHQSQQHLSSKCDNQPSSSSSCLFVLTKEKYTMKWRDGRTGITRLEMQRLWKNPSSQNQNRTNENLLSRCENILYPYRHRHYREWPGKNSALTETLVGLHLTEGKGIECHTILHDTICYFNVRSKADMSQIDLPHETNNEKVEKNKKN